MPEDHVPEDHVPEDGDGAPTHSPRPTPEPSPALRQRAALCYAIPVIPALVAFARRDAPGFTRLHAARALCFYALIAVAQITLGLTLVVVGNALGTALLPALASAIVVYGGWVAFAVLCVRAWRRYLAEALDGQPVPRRGLGAWAQRLAATRPRASALARSRQNNAVP